MKLEKREIDLLACPPERQDMLVFDDELTGYGMRVTMKGAKSFIFQYRRGKAVRRMVLGRYGDITPAQARRMAEVARGEVAAGRDPVGQRAADLAAEAARRAEARRATGAAGFTLDKLVTQWVDRGLAGASPSHRKEAPAAIRRSLAKFRDRPAALIEVTDLQRAIDAIASKRPTMARRVRDYGRAAYNWAVSRSLVDRNPFEFVRVESRLISRDRALSDEEVAAAWSAAGALPYPFGSFYRLLMLTLQRRNEVAGMAWSELAEDLATWTIPATRAKNGKAHIVHLAEPARVILRDLAREHRKPDQALVFTTTGKTPVSGFSRAIAILKKRIARDAKERNAKLPPDDYRVHDFRRTGVTTLARLGVAPHVADKLLNHIQGSAIRGVAAVYQRHEFLTEREAAAKLWAEHVLAIAAKIARRPIVGGNVVRLQPGPRKQAGAAGL